MERFSLTEQQNVQPISIQDLFRTYKPHEFNINKYEAGTIIEIPTLEEIEIALRVTYTQQLFDRSIQSRDEKGRFSSMGVWREHDWRTPAITVLINGKLTFIDMRSIVHTRIYYNGDDYPLYKTLMKFCSDAEMLKHISGKKFIIDKVIGHWIDILVDYKPSGKKRLIPLAMLKEFS